MKIAAVCTLRLILAASADISPSNEADMTPGGRRNEVDRRVASAQFALTKAEGLRSRSRLKGKADSKHSPMKIPDEEREDAAYEKHFHDTMERLRMITATCHEQQAKVNENLELLHGFFWTSQMRRARLKNKLNLTTHDLLEAQTNSSTLQAQLERALARQQSGDLLEQLQAEVKEFSNEVAADKHNINNLIIANAGRIQSIQQLKLTVDLTSPKERNIKNLTTANAEQIKRIQQLKLTFDETSHALNVSYANEDNMQKQIASLNQLLQKHARDKETEHTNRIRAEQKVSELSKEVQRLEVQLKGARSNSSELVAEREAAHNEKLTYAKNLADITKKLSTTEKARDSASKALADAHSQLLAEQKKTQEANTQIFVEQKKSQEAMQQMKATYEKEMARLKAESQKGWMSKMMG
eukprot:gnl/TRDRNA2_/TRDRNA2_170923_c2_seq6.p1 gnl/TRDRNA2_/TRDRNA2_170923_c2~~gnl/TRDRNA2_/TRDRNA2_170923_c2_seq6.p1  ORF type:complete len:412 (+),score=107.59 gnl/TRDRNA2_/TRDRNA2_170923_c2_seq6:74-1309(+)